MASLWTGLLIGLATSGTMAVAGCGSDVSDDVTIAGEVSTRPPEIAFIRATGTRLVDETVRSTDAHVFVWRPGADPEQLTSGPGEDSSPSWSPDGKSIFFSRARGARGEATSAEIYRVDAGGGRATRVTRCGPPFCAGDTQPAVSPDGKTLTFLRIGLGKSKIGALDLPDGRLTFTSLPDRLRPYTALSWRSLGEVTLSAYGRGTKVRAYESTPGLSRLTLLAVCRKPRRCAVPGPVSWSADPAGAGAVEATLGNDSAIHTISDPPAASPAIRCVGARCPHRPAISADGRRLAFDAGEEDFGGDLYVSEPTGTAMRRITKGKDLDCCAAWRP